LVGKKKPLVKQTEKEAEVELNSIEMKSKRGAVQKSPELKSRTELEPASTDLIWTSSLTPRPLRICGEVTCHAKEAGRPACGSDEWQRRQGIFELGEQPLDLRWGGTRTKGFRQRGGLGEGRGEGPGLGTN
jgi:hypothetical protein